MLKVKCTVLFCSVIIMLTFFQTDSFARESRDLDYREIFERHQMVRLIINAESGKILDASKEAENFYGYTREALLSMNIADLNTLGKEEVKKEMKAATLEKRNYFCFRHRLASGEIREVEVHSYPIDHEGEPLLYSVIIDRTELVEAERRDANRIFINYAFAGVLVVGITGFLLLRKIKENYRRLSNYDQLTMVHSRHYLDHWQQKKKNQMQRRSRSLTVVLLDIDGFKKINDIHGHLVGDDVLVEVAGVLRDFLRSEDLIVRYGGDEFVLIMEGTNEEQAKTIMIRIQEKLRSKGVFPFSIDISYGIVEGQSAQHIFKAIDDADEKMYEMKNKRKNP